MGAREIKLPEKDPEHLEPQRKLTETSKHS